MAAGNEQSAVRKLADRLGIIAEYTDQTGKEKRVTTDETRVALLAVMGVDASSESLARRALERAEEEERSRIVDPVHVVRQDAEQRTKSWFLLRQPPDAGNAARWSIELREEGGRVHRMEGRARGSRDGTIRVPLPPSLGSGYHRTRVQVETPKGTRRGEQSLIVVPPACPSPDDVLGNRRVFGITANLYTVRSARNWGVGDLTDLAQLLRWAGSVGADFVGVNPLHALRNAGGDVSPYSPVSRLYRNVLYIDVEAVPEMAQSPEARRLVCEPGTQRELARLREGSAVEYERVMALKLPVLRALHAAFRADGTRARRAECERYLEEQGETLTDFATFLALSDHLAGDGASGGSWRDWPEEYRDPRSPAVRRFREEHEDEIDFHRWLQFVIDRQLAAAAGAGRGARMEIGLYQDLAIGTSPAGSDVWMNRELFVEGASIGAPPDPYSATGQNWGLPPIDPHALRRQRYEYWIRLVRSSLRHSGALRIDHVMGLFRQFWIPEGRSGKEGAYVRFPSEDLIGILALETSRCGALVVGEDLGTVPEDVPPAMRRWNVLSSKVLTFEREGEGGFKPASSYPAMALATANTHDMATLEGFWCARDVDVRREVGLIESDEDAEKARAEREREKRALLDRLRADGVLPRDGAEPDGVELRAAVHDFLCRTPAALVGVSLDDIVGEREPVNVPGVGADKFTSWTRRLTMPLEALPTDPDVKAVLRCRRGDRR